MQALRILTASLLILCVLASLPVAQAQTATVEIDDFDDDATLTSPASQANPPTYTYSASSANAFVQSNQASSTPNSLVFSTTASNGYAAFDTIFDVCVSASGIDFKWYVPALPAAAQTENIVVSASPGSVANGVGFKLTDGGILQGIVATGGSQNIYTGFPTGTWVDLHISGIDCTSNKAIFSSNMLSFVISLDFAGDNIAGVVDDISIFHDGATANTVYLDDVSINGATVLDADVVFCADPNVLDYDGNPATPTTSTGASDDYGYNYRRGATFFDQSEGDNPNGIGLSTGFEYVGGSTEGTWDYSAKSFSTGTKALHENITIESGTDGASSVFRVNFHTQTGSSPDDTAKGNGLTTGHFTDHVEAQFTETGNTWSLGFFYVDGGGSRTQMGGSVNFGDANDATNFVVWLDTRATANAIGTLDENYPSNYYVPGGGSLHADPFVMVTTASASPGPSGEDIAVVAIRYLDDVAGNPFLDDTVGDVWNVGYGTSSLSFATTALDENLQENRPNTSDEGGLDSTCIFDDAGTAVFAGSPGAVPGSSLPETPDGGDDGPTFFNGVTEAALMGFFGIVLAASFAASMNEKTGAGAAGLAIFATMGIWVAYYLNYFGIEVVVSLTVGFVAIIFIGIKSAVSGGET